MNELFASPVNVDLLAAALLGGLIGFERELAGKDPSLRTFSLICLGSCMFTQLSVVASADLNGVEPSRIAAQIVPGIGFLGAGAIFRSPKGVSGLTTAALMWVTAAIGMAVGFGRQEIAVSGTVTALFVTMSFRLMHAFIQRVKPGGREPGPGDRQD